MANLPINQLAKHFAKQALAPLYIIYGEELLLALEAADSIRQRAREQGFLEREVFTMETVHFDWSQLFDAVNSFSLFADKKLIELRIPSGKVGTEGAKSLQALIPHLHEALCLIITLPKLDKATKQSQWFKALDQAGFSINAQLVERDELGDWIRQRCAANKQILSEEALACFVDRVEGNLLAAKQDIERLALLEPQGEISLETIEQLVGNVARFEPFSLSEAWLTQDRARARRMLHTLQAASESEVLILWILTEDIRALIGIIEGRTHGKSLAELYSMYRIWGKKRSLIERALPRHPVWHWANALHQCASIDRMIKGAKSGNVWHELERLILFLCES